MKRSTLARLAVLLLVAGALALSGCGGDDNGIDQSLHDTVTAERDAAQIKADEAAALAAAETMRADEAEALAAAETMRADGAEEMMPEAISAAMQADMDTRAKYIIAAMAQADTEDTDDLMVKVSHSAGGEFKASAEVGYVLDDMAPPPMIEGWNGATLTRDKIPPEGTDAVYVYSDIEMATGMAFAAAYADPYGITDGNVGKAMSDKFPDPADRTAILEETGTWAGSYDGVAGVFKCIGAVGEDCTVMSDEDGDLTFLDTSGEGMVMFSPTDAAEMVSGSPDTDYLTFGFWLSKPKDGTQPHDFNTFQQGEEEFTDVDVAGLTLKARYEGNAAGKYVVRTQVAPTKIGIFTADAELEADFDASTITGAITNFMDGYKMLDGWSLTLVSLALVESHDFGAVTGEDLTEGMIGNVPVKGNWTGSFYGNGRQDDYPGSVAGEFDAFSAETAATAAGSLVALEGAFGAHNTKME